MQSQGDSYDSQIDEILLQIQDSILETNRFKGKKTTAHYQKSSETSAIVQNLEQESFSEL